MSRGASASLKISSHLFTVASVLMTVFACVALLAAVWSRGVTLPFVQVASQPVRRVGRLATAGHTTTPTPDLTVGVHVVQQWYADASPARRMDLAKGLWHNLNNPSVCAVHLLALHDSLPFLSSLLLRLRREDCRRVHVMHLPVGRRVLWSDLLGYSDRHLKGRVVIAQNADIYYDSTLSTLAQLAARDRVFVLTRTDPGCVPPAGPLHPRNTCDSTRFMGSADSFTFVPPLPDGVSRAAGFSQSLIAAENSVEWLLVQSGKSLSNPCPQVMAWHSHCSGIRRYGRRDRVKGRGWCAARPSNASTSDVHCRNGRAVKLDRRIPLPPRPNCTGDHCPHWICSADDGLESSNEGECGRDPVSGDFFRSEFLDGNIKHKRITF